MTSRSDNEVFDNNEDKVESYGSGEGAGAPDPYNTGLGGYGGGSAQGIANELTFTKSTGLSGGHTNPDVGREDKYGSDDKFDPVAAKAGNPDGEAVMSEGPGIFDKVQGKSALRNA